MPPNQPGSPPQPISPPIRALTTASGRVLSFKKQARLPGEASTIKQKVSAYDLDWEDLEAYLREKKFPKDKFPTLNLVEDESEDFYHLDLPEELTAHDYAEIKKLKRSHKAQAQNTQRAVTPD